MTKLAIITTHPIQYYAPIFKLLHKRNVINLKVFYTWGQTATNSYDPGFNRKITWDTPLLGGYPYEWVNNTSVNPGSHHFKGIINPGLIAQVNNWQPDAVLIIGWAYHSHLRALHYFKNKIPVYFRGDSTLLNKTSKIRDIIKSIFLRWVYNHIDHAFYVGSNNKDYYRKYGLKDKQLSFAPHAVDNDRFKMERSAEAAQLRASLKINEEDILILFAGKFEPVKNIKLLLTAFIKLNTPNVHLLLTGNGIDEPLLKEQVAESNKTDKIHFLDFKNQNYMPVLYQASDLFCLPSKSESWGLSVNEAMACKKAILVSDKCGCAIDLVREEENGAIFKSGSLDDLMSCLTKLTKSKNLLTDYGNASGSIIKPWNFLNIAKAIENKLADAR
ncbi:MAG TPA: glycosyltransferase family 4 protein [Mucilaginibacter sp.]